MVAVRAARALRRRGAAGDRADRRGADLRARRGDGRGHERLPHQPIDVARLRATLARYLRRTAAPPEAQNSFPTFSSVSTPSTAKIAAAMPCTRRIGTFFATTSPSSTAGTLAIIMPSVVPATTATRSP